MVFVRCFVSRSRVEESRGLRGFSQLGFSFGVDSFDLVFLVLGFG